MVVISLDNEHIWLYKAWYPFCTILLWKKIFYALQWDLDENKLQGRWSFGFHMSTDGKWEEHQKNRYPYRNVI